MGRTERSRQPTRKPRSYFPRSFTISKKYPGLGANISKVQRGGARGSEGGGGRKGSAADQNKFWTAGKGDARRAEAAAGGPSRIARGSRRAGVPFESFASVLPSLGFREQILSVHWMGKGACFHEPAPTQPSRLGPSSRGRVGQARAEGRRGAGEGTRRVGRRGREGRGAPRRLAEGRCGRRPLCSPPACAPLPFAFIPEARACLRSVPA